MAGIMTSSSANYLNDFYSCTASAAHKILSPATARERHHKIRAPLIKHSLISFGASRLSKFAPLRNEWRVRYPATRNRRHRLRPAHRLLIGSGCRAVDHDSERAALRIEAREGVPDVIPVAVIPTTAY
jgi:hypothetical protein